MLFPTVKFATFFMIVWAALLLLRGRPRPWRLVLLAANWVFYAAWSTGFVALLAASIAGNHGLARLVARPASERSRRWSLRLGIAGNLAVLAWFKYYGFFAESLRDALSSAGVHVDPPVLDIALPLGVSFFTFQAISYLVEVQRRAVEPAPLLDEAVWLSFFPTVVSGPITRASEFMPQLRAAPGTDVASPEAFLLIARGLFKKVVVASYLAAAITDDVFATPERFTSLDILVGVYAYAALLYADFSGYTDMARGLALLLGIRLPPNFASPYRATSIHEFWDRWHITLSRWLRDFLFFPLGRRARNRRFATYRNLVLVMLFAGLWHGAAWTFVAFGAVHGVALAAARARRDERRRRGLPPHRRHGPHVGGWLVTFHVTCLGWLFFRADSVGTALEMLGRLATGWDRPTALTPWLVAVVAGVVAVQFTPRDAWDRTVAGFARLAPAGQAAGLALAMSVIDVLGPAGVPPFIYFRF